MVAAGLEQHRAQKVQVAGIESKPIRLRHALGAKAPLQVALDLQGVVHPNGVDLGGLLAHLQLLGAAQPIFGDTDFVQPIAVGAHHKHDPPHGPLTDHRCRESLTNSANRPTARAMPRRCHELVKLSGSSLSGKSAGQPMQWRS